jgi:hypothetical protein
MSTIKISTVVTETTSNVVDKEIALPFFGRYTEEYTKNEAFIKVTEAGVITVANNGISARIVAYSIVKLFEKEMARSEAITEDEFNNALIEAVTFYSKIK